MTCSVTFVSAYFIVIRSHSDPLSFKHKSCCTFINSSINLIDNVHLYGEKTGDLCRPKSVPFLNRARKPITDIRLLSFTQITSAGDTGTQCCFETGPSLVISHNPKLDVPTYSNIDVVCSVIHIHSDSF